MPKSTQRTAKQKAAWANLSPWIKKQIRKAPLSVWARRIRREFKYECASCQKKRSLEAHHIYFKSLFPSRKEDLDNGLLLCLKCHDKIHSLYIENPSAYWARISTLVSSRIRMKAIPLKKRNPSQSQYLQYQEEIPEVQSHQEPHDEAPKKRRHRISKQKQETDKQKNRKKKSE